MLWEDLNPELEPGQPAYDFAACNDNRIRVIAGPGAGKSFAMKLRIIRLLEVGVDPKQILPVTFTHLAKEALENDLREIKDEIEKKLNDGVIVSADKKSAEKIINGVKKIKATTLHSLCLRILRDADPNKNRRLMNDFEIPPMRSDLKELTESKVPSIRALTDYFMDLSTGRRNFGTLQSELRKWLEAHGGMILGELVSRTNKYLERDASGKWKYAAVLVDEYQDLNPAEQELVSLLTAENGSLTVIGDEDQSIYSFRGAHPLGLRQFERHNPNCTDFSFEDCYRCPQSVVRNATKLIQHNSNRFKKNFNPFTKDVARASSPTKSENEIEFNTVGSTKVYRWLTPEAELDGLSQVIRDELSDPNSTLKPGNIIVLIPKRDRAKQILDALKTKGLDAVSCFRGEVFDDPAARESFSWLCLLADERDLISWRYLLGKDSARSGYLSSGYCRILKYANAPENNGIGVYDTLELCCGKNNPIPYTGKIIQRYKQYKDELRKKREAIKEDPEKLSEVLNIPVDAGEGYFDLLTQVIDDNRVKRGQPDWLPSIRDGVLQAIYHPEAATMSDKIRVMSLHAAKGLSAGLVVIAGAVDGCLPMPDKDLQEQRRLFYVAITRCKAAKIKDGQTNDNAGGYSGKVIISCYITKTDGTESRHPSPFIDEMGWENVTFNI